MEESERTLNIVYTFESVISPIKASPGAASGRGQASQVKRGIRVGGALRDFL